MSVTRTLTGRIGGFSDGLVVPLTTAFTPSSGCPWPMTCLDIQASQDKERLKDCCPPEFQKVCMYGFYSPGVCPSGYTIGCAYSVNMPYSAWEMTSSESAVWCVPSSYACVHSPGKPDQTGFDSRATATSNPRDTVPAFQIRWQKSDSSLLVAATSSTEQSSSTSSPTATPGPTSSQGPSATSLITTTTETAGGSPGGDPTAEPRSRNTGVLVGEILGPILGVFLIVVLWFWIWRRRSLSRLPGATDAAPEAPDPEGDDPGDEAEAKRQGTTYLDGNPISELESKKPDLVHLDSNPVSELEDKRQQFAYLDGNPLSELGTVGSLAGRQTPQHGASPQNHGSTAAYISELPADPPKKPMIPRKVSSHGTEPIERSPATQDVAMTSSETSSTLPGARESAAIQSNALKDELDALLKKDAELQARKATLLELQKIHDEEDVIRQRIIALQEQTRSSTPR